MESPIKIRQESPADVGAVHGVNRLAFGQENEALLVDALRQNAEVFVPELSLVAVVGEEVVGHILFTRITILDAAGIRHGSLALAPMAVHPAHQRSGIGGQLIRKGLEIARQLGYGSVIVLGHRHYYPKFGFAPAGNWKIVAPFEVPAPAFMAIELVADGLRGVSGTVVYPREFDMV